MLTLSTELPTTYYAPAAARILAEQCTADDGEWTYKAENIGNQKGLLVIRVYDETGHPLGYF
jgi:hypothetical protein